MKKIIFLILLFSGLYSQDTLDVGVIAGTDVGANCVVNYSYLHIANAANGDGYVDSITVILGGTATADTLFIGSVYLSSGTTYTLRDSSFIIITGSNDGTYGFSAPEDFDRIQVNEGDLIATFAPSTNGASIRRTSNAACILRYTSAGTKFYEQASTDFVTSGGTHAGHIEFIGALGLNLYVSNKGSDDSSGVWMDEAWATADYAASNATNPGDNILLRTDNTFSETVIMDASGTSGNPITLTCYDSATGLTGAAALALGDTATISGADLVNTWVACMDTETVILGTMNGDWSTSSTDGWARNEVLANVTYTDGMQIRILVEGHSANGTIVMGASVGEQDGTNGEDYASAPTRITFATNDTITIAAGISTWSDWVNYTWTRANDHLIHITADDDGGQVSFRRQAPNAVSWRGKGDGDVTLTLDVVDTDPTNHFYAVEKMQIISAHKWYSLGMSIEPNQVFINGIRATWATKSSGVGPDSTAFWTTAGGDTLFIYTITDSDTSNIEAGQRNCITSNQKDHITINSLHFTKANNHCIIANGDNDNWIVTNSIFSYPYRVGVRLTDSGADGNNDNWTISSNTVRYCGETGIHLSYCTNGTVSSNTVHDNSILMDYEYIGGIKIWGSDATDMTIENNIVYNSGLGTTGNRGTGIWIDKTGSGNIVRYNLLHDNKFASIKIEKTDSSQVYYNIIYDDTTTESVLHGNGILLDGYVNDNQIYNNTIYNCYIGININGNGTPDSTSNNLVKNNIVENCTIELRAVNGGENDGVNGIGNVYTYNCFSAEASNFIEWGDGVYKSTYDAWETSYSSATNSVETDPFFTDAANDDFTLKEKSPCIDAGTNVGLVLDYAGNTVPFNARADRSPDFDIGAHEYSKRIPWSDEKRFIGFPNWWKYLRH